MHAPYKLKPPWEPHSASARSRDARPPSATPPFLAPPTDHTLGPHPPFPPSNAISSTGLRPLLPSSRPEVHATSVGDSTLFSPTHLPHPRTAPTFSPSNVISSTPLRLSSRVEVYATSVGDSTLFSPAHRPHPRTAPKIYLSNAISSKGLPPEHNFRRRLHPI